MENAAPPPSDRIDALARRRFGGPARAVTRMTGGASQELWAFDVGGDRFVLRRQADDDRVDRSATISLADEAQVIRAMAPRAVPVAPVALVLTPEDGLGDGFVMRRMPGEALGRRVVHDPAFAAVRPRLAAACGTILAAIHATPVATLPALPELTPRAALARLDEQLVRSGQSRPVFAAALHWLERHCPEDAPSALVHGDFRTGNLLVTDTGISAVLDWEGCHLGDPLADLGWLTMPVWRFGRIDRPVGGFGLLADLCAGYAAAGGAAIDPARLRFWAVFGMLRWGLTCVGMAEAVARGERSLERAAVGRRACEAEVELLHALAPAGAG